LKTYIGNDSDIDILDPITMAFVQVSLFAEKRWFAYQTGKLGGFFVHANHVPEWDWLGLQDQCRRFNTLRSRSGIKVGVSDLGSKAPLSPDLALALGEFQRTTRQHQRIGERLISVMAVTETTRLWAMSFIPADFGKEIPRLVLAGVVSTIFALLAGLAWAVMVMGRRFSFSIRYRLVLLFGFAGGVPLIVVVITGWGFLHQRFQAGVRQTHDDAERALRAFDQRFPQMRDLMQRTLAASLKKCRLQTIEHRKQTDKVLRRIHKVYQPNDLMIFDQKGNLVWDARKKEGTWKSDRGRKMMSGLGGSLLAALNREEFTGKMDVAVTFLESFAGAGLNPIAYMARNLGQIIDFFDGRQLHVDLAAAPP
jgi:hypothetical protein